MREHRYSTYIMASRSGVLYIGVTSNLEKRVREHKDGAYDGFSKKYKCHRLVYYEVYDYIQAAIGREKEMKGWSRAKKIALIESTNLRWEDLSESWGREFLVRGQSMKEADEARARRIKLQLDDSSPKSQASGD
jgi:putative endonuclease